MYALTFDECDARKNLLMSLQEWVKYPQFQIYFMQWWDSSLYSYYYWAHAFRQNLPHRGNNTTNFVEVVMRIIKDLVLCRTRAFNILQLLVFLTGKLEDYYCDRCLDAAYLRCSKLLLCAKTAPPHLEPLINSDHHNIPEWFSVPSESEQGKTYEVNLEIGTCTCADGCCGRLCKHQQWCISKYSIRSVKTALTRNSGLRKTFYFIATGQLPPPGFLSALTDSVEGPIPSVDGMDVELITADDSTQFQLSERSSGTKNMTPDFALIQSLNERIDQFSNKLKSLLLNDPSCFGPPIETFLQNFEKHAKNDNQLVHGLTNSFRNVSLRKMAKLEVQPTSISRRKTAYKGKRSVIAGRLPKRRVYDPINVIKRRSRRIYKRNPRPHRLNEIVGQNKPPIPSIQRNTK